MSEDVRTAHSRVREYPRRLTGGFPKNVIPDPALVCKISGLLSDLNGLPGRDSSSKVFALDENELGLPGVRLLVRYEEQPYLRGAINAMESLIDKHGVEKMRRCGVIGEERSMPPARCDT